MRLWSLCHASGIIHIHIVHISLKIISVAERLCFILVYLPLCLSSSGFCYHWVVLSFQCCSWQLLLVLLSWFLCIFLMLICFVYIHLCVCLHAETASSRGLLEVTVRYSHLCVDDILNHSNKSSFCLTWTAGIKYFTLYKKIFWGFFKCPQQCEN